MWYSILYVLAISENYKLSIMLILPIYNGESGSILD